MDEPKRAWTSTGQVVEIQKDQVDRVPDFDPRSGAHLWTWGVVFRATPGVETPMLDTENLLLITGPVCYYCEQPYSERVAMRRCSGDP